MGRLIADKFKEWALECDERFAELKANEEELNRIFIKIYGLEDELTPEVEDKDITVRRADLAREIRSLISYAVGCMFGRYSPYKEGLIYAGGEFDEQQYARYGLDSINTTESVVGSFVLPDKDNVIPITDEEYLDDDIAGKFFEFVKIIYGKDTLEANLDFIAKALGGKGESPREIIRKYLLNDFYTDHLRIYQKRPIYWQLDSGKNNGFKALIYMHRYNRDTMGIARTEYLHKIQKIYESEISRMDEIIEGTSNSRDVIAAQKRKEKLTKQLQETRSYDLVLSHVALERIPIDLDDGVKVNYAKFQNIEVSSDVKKAKMNILTEIK